LMRQNSTMQKTIINSTSPKFLMAIAD